MNQPIREEWISEELDRLRTRVKGLESGLQDAVVPAFQKLRNLVSGESDVNPELRVELVRGLAELKYQQQGLQDEQANWYQSEKEVDFILERLGKQHH